MFPVVYHNKMDRLSTTPTQFFICNDIFNQIGPSRRIAWQYWPRFGNIGVSVLHKNTTMHSSVQEPNRESTTLRLPTCAHLLRYTAASWDFATAHMPSVGMGLATLQLLFRALTD